MDVERTGERGMDWQKMTEPWRRGLRVFVRSASVRVRRSMVERASLSAASSFGSGNRMTATSSWAADAPNDAKTRKERKRNAFIWGVISPAGEKAMSFRWCTEDGEDRVAHVWRAGESRGVVACVHGLSGSGEQFAPLPERVPGISFYALDLRGQGSDPVAERRGAALDLEWQMHDLGAFLRAVAREHPGEPLFLLGESMGSLLAAAYAAREGVSSDVALAGVVLSVPVVALAREIPGPMRWMLRMLGRAFPKARLSPSRFVNGKSVAPPITRDRAYQDSLREKPHHITNFTLGFLVELGDLIDSSREVARRLELPTLVLAAGQDCFVRVDQIEEWFLEIASGDKTLLVYPESYHLLWHDWDRERVVEDLGQWLRRDDAMGQCNAVV